jgi:hypothetical protein
MSRRKRPPHRCGHDAKPTLEALYRRGPDGRPRRILLALHAVRYGDRGEPAPR